MIDKRTGVVRQRVLEVVFIDLPVEIPATNALGDGPDEQATEMNRLHGYAPIAADEWSP
jgi:hypothetical protein